MLVRRALITAGFHELFAGGPERVWPALFAKQITGPDCPPAKGLPEDVRRQLEQLAAKREGEPATDPGTS